MDEAARRYLNLLKHTITDYLRIDNPHASAMPIHNVRPTTAVRRLRNRVLQNIVSTFGFSLVKPRRDSLEDQRHKRKFGMDWPPLAETMVGLERLDNLEMIVSTIVEEKIPGDLLEAGVWRGGASIYLQALLTVLDARDRMIWLCDSFEGLPPPDPKFPADKGLNFNDYSVLAVSVETVKENFHRYDLFGNNLKFIKGFFKDTLHSVEVEQLSLLRLDGDLYSSTIETLEPLYDKVSSGGFVVIDDYHIPACAEAIHDFRKAHGVADELVVIDQAASYWRKS